MNTINVGSRQNKLNRKRGRVNIGNLLVLFLAFSVLSGTLLYITGYHKTLPSTIRTFYNDTIQERFNRPPEHETKKLMKAIRDLRFKIEAGLSYNSYSENVSKIYVDYKNFAEKYPKSKITRAFEEIILCHIAAKDVWNRAIFEKEEWIINLRQTILENDYPSMKSLRDFGFGWYYKDVLRELWKNSTTNEQAVQKVIDDAY
jgi:hypothetical protein